MASKMPKTNKSISFLKLKKTIMAKYEIVKETSFTGVTLYSIEKEGQYIINSCNTDLNKVEEYLQNLLTNGEKRIKETIKTIEVNDEKIF
jgi:hypothetical protein